MVKYRVLVIAHSLKNNLVGKFNEVVDESQLTSSPQELIDAGFIELAESVEEIELEEAEVVQPIVAKKKVVATKK